MLFDTGYKSAAETTTSNANEYFFLLSETHCFAESKLGFVKP